MTKLKFEAPVALWAGSARAHRARSDRAFIAFVLMAALTAIFAVAATIFGGDAIAEAYVSERCNLDGTCFSEFSAKGPLVTGGILLATSFSVWLIRSVNRLYLSERHLALAADERRAFAETYLALISDQSVSRDQEAIVLAALFRPSGDMQGSDEGGIDFTAAAVLAKVLSGKPS